MHEGKNPDHCTRSFCISDAGNGDAPQHSALLLPEVPEAQWTVLFFVFLQKTFPDPDKSEPGEISFCRRTSSKYILHSPAPFVLYQSIQQCNTIHESPPFLFDFFLHLLKSLYKNPSVFQLVWHETAENGTNYIWGMY